MSNFFTFIRKERLYILLLIFVSLVYVASNITDDVKDSKKTKTAAAEKKASQAKLSDERAEAEKILHSNKGLAIIYSLVSLLVFLILLLGIVVDAILLSRAASGHPPDIRTYNPGVIRWSVWDVARVAILFLFFGYMLVMIESCLTRVFPLLKSSNYRMVVNSSFLDVLTIAFILYFTVEQYGGKLADLGISLKNFFRNVFYGVVGYIAAVPLLVIVLILTAVVINIFKYVPEKQFVVELFLKEKNAVILVYTSLFAAIAGPIIEELFFRGFMYSAFKKHMGKFSAMLATAALFAVLHSHPVGFLPIMVLGVLLAYMYEKTGTLVSSITIHMMHNLTMVGFVFLAKNLKA